MLNIKGVIKTEEQYEEALERAYELMQLDLTEDSQYNLTFRFSHVYDYQFATVPINFDIEKPNGEKKNFLNLQFPSLTQVTTNGYELRWSFSESMETNFIDPDVLFSWAANLPVA